MKGKKIKVLVVDDSAFMRKIIGDIIRSDSELEFVGVARNGEDAIAKKEALKPDVMTLDVEMPVLNGLETLKRIMKTGPLPIIMVSSHTREGEETTLEALSTGAVDFVAKPSLLKGEGLSELEAMLPQKIKAAARARLFDGSMLKRGPIGRDPIMEKVATAGIGRVDSYLREEGTRHSGHPIVAIGASTGGPRALESILRGFPDDLPAAVMITQHMPAGFTESLARRLDRVSRIRVKEATGAENILPGWAYVAPGGYHLLVKAGQTMLSSAPPVQHVRPSADVMMKSLAQYYGSNVIGVILTGMGKDGAEGMEHIKKNGGRTIVQDPSTAVISSMPQAAINNGAADAIIPLDRIADGVVRLLYRVYGKGR
ncbi:MAG TPA: chemotaxis response regulator protein-glutamate methylesterase [Firmicutes bacterium]|nr:chemotaxis response regulator protein-glutamate methylesterase [Bacillota bacterium]